MLVSLIAQALHPLRRYRRARSDTLFCALRLAFREPAAKRGGGDGNTRHPAGVKQQTRHPAGSAKRSRMAPSIKHEADGFRGVGLRNFSPGTGPLRDSQRTGFRRGHLMKRDAPHMGFSPHADLPSALSASRAFRERVRLPHPSPARRLARCPCRMGDGIIAQPAIPRISFFNARGGRRETANAPGGRLDGGESPAPNQNCFAHRGRLRGAESRCAIKGEGGISFLRDGSASRARRPAPGTGVAGRNRRRVAGRNQKTFRSKARGLGRPRASRPCRPSARSNTRSCPLICR
jgi:hypothetical protein